MLLSNQIFPGECDVHRDAIRSMAHIMFVRTLIALLFLITSANAGDVFDNPDIPWLVEYPNGDEKNPIIHRMTIHTHCVRSDEVVTCENGFVGSMKRDGETLTVQAKTWDTPMVLELEHFPLTEVETRHLRGKFHGRHTW